MCGIAGYIGERELETSQVERCLHLMQRRGPDAQQTRHWLTPVGTHVHLLHSRLSIIDLTDRANQPFTTGSRWIAFNGELYNYVELRDSLRESGVRFATESDTEVLLRAIDARGWDVLDQCEGMWAFAVYDEADGSLTLCRDRFGEKPLYLYRDATGTYFGSEVKFITALRGRALPVNYDQVYRFLVNGYKALYKEPRTFFEGLSEVPPATTLRIEPDGTSRCWRYWHPRYDADEEMSCEEAVAGVRERLIRSVELRLRADVPLAFCMSGGVDSNALIAIAKRVLGYDVHGFTIANADARYEEEALVADAVQQLGVRHTSVPVTVTDFLPRLRELVAHHDAPVYTITYYAHWLLMQSIADRGYRVSVSGSAADELFSGYYDHFLAYLHDVHDNPGLYQAERRAWVRHVKPVVRNPYLQNPDLFVDNPGLRDHVFLNADRFATALTVEWSEPFSEHRYTGQLLRNRMLNELFHESVPVILHEDDLNAMYYSIENRSPFLDRELFEFCSRVPTRHLVRDGRAKAVLRDAVRGIAPDAIVDNRRKVGFNAPIFSFLDVHDPAVRTSLLADSPVFDHVRRECIEEMLCKPELANSESKFLFSFVATKIFLEQHAG